MEQLVTQPAEVSASLGGAFQGSSRISKELALWSPTALSADMEINPEKEILDARSRDMTRNDGYVSGAVDIYKDGIVGAQFTLNARPNVAVLRAFNPAFDEAWSEEFQAAVEARFALAAESPNNWLDASRQCTLTGLVRLAVGVHVMQGEVLASVEWLRQAGRPFSTAIQMIDPDRLSNPYGWADSETLRRGVRIDKFGAPLEYNIREAHPGDIPLAALRYRWKAIPARKPWGRLQVIHIHEPMRPSQTRGVGAMVSVLKQLRMTNKYQDIVLQNAVTNATYAAAIESELPDEVVYAQLGSNSSSTAIHDYLALLASYIRDTGNNLAIDGVKIPHLFPGTKLKMMNAGQPGGLGTGFEESLLRHIAAGLGLNYEQFARDFSKTNYSSARASMAETWKTMQSKKRIVADRFAGHIYALWLEEEVNAGRVPLPANVTAADLYSDPLLLDALSQADWIGASRGQIDELKETQAAMLRITAGLSTYEDEAARLGKDWRKVFNQRQREQKEAEALGIRLGQTESPAQTVKDAGATKPTGGQDDSTDDADAQNGSDDSQAFSGLMELATKLGDALNASASATPSVTVTPEIKVEIPPMTVNVQAPAPAAAPVEPETVLEYLHDSSGNITGAVALVDGAPKRVSFEFSESGAVVGAHVAPEI